MTETSPVTFSGYSHDPLEVRHSTIGYPADHTEVSFLIFFKLVKFNDLN